jgi:hypothetical protein
MATHLTGLPASNPLGFFAALGVQVVFAGDCQQPHLWWSDDVVPHAVVDAEFTVARVIARALDQFQQWAGCRAVTPDLPPKHDVKFEPHDLRKYLESTRNDVGARFAQAVVAEGSYDGKGVAKPTDLYFTAGRQLFLNMVTGILESVTEDDLKVGLEGPWTYDRSVPTLMWDTVDDRNYALAASNPAKETKLSNPGPEALAILGLTTHPVFVGHDRTATTAFSGGWKRGAFTWPVWQRPAGGGATRAMVQHASLDRSSLLEGWGISRLYRSQVHRSDQGGYGTFRPAEVIWSKPTV